MLENTKKFLIILLFSSIFLALILLGNKKVFAQEYFFAEGSAIDSDSVDLVMNQEEYPLTGALPSCGQADNRHIPTYNIHHGTFTDEDDLNTPFQGFTFSYDWETLSPFVIGETTQDAVEGVFGTYSGYFYVVFQVAERLGNCSQDIKYYVVLNLRWFEGEIYVQEFENEIPYEESLAYPIIHIYPGNNDRVGVDIPFSYFARINNQLGLIKDVYIKVYDMTETLLDTLYWEVPSIFNQFLIPLEIEYTHDTAGQYKIVYGVCSLDDVCIDLIPPTTPWNFSFTYTAIEQETPCEWYDIFCQGKKLFDTLFIPTSEEVEWGFGFKQLYEKIQTKPPFGYGFLVYDLISGVGNETEGAFELEELTPITDQIFTPIRTAFVWLLWFLFFWFLIKRFKHFEF